MNYNSLESFPNALKFNSTGEVWELVKDLTKFKDKAKNALYRCSVAKEVIGMENVFSMANIQKLYNSNLITLNN